MSHTIKQLRTGTTELDWWSVEHFRVMTLSKAVVRSILANIF